LAPAVATCGNLRHWGATDMSGHGDKLSRKWEAAIAALLAEPTVEAAAATAGVSSRTLRGWLAQPAFAAAYRDARAALLERVTGHLLRTCVRAVQTLEAELGGERAADRIRAATALLAHARSNAAELDLEGRIRELEQAARHQGGRP
jgi:hypothetical protein